MPSDKKQIDCFNLQMNIMKGIGIWPMGIGWPYYKYYTAILIFLFSILYDVLANVSIYFMEKNVNSFVQEFIFYFTELNVLCKVLTILVMKKEIVLIMNTLESDIFQPTSEKGLQIVKDAKKFNIKYFKIITGLALLTHFNHIFVPLFLHFFKDIKLKLPVSSYSFLSEDIRENYIYPLYFYQGAGIHFHMWGTVTFDTYFVGLMNLTISQLDILYVKFRNVIKSTETTRKQAKPIQLFEDDRESTSNDYVLHLNRCIMHFENVVEFFNMIQKIFSVSIFVQFSVGSGIMCICLFRFTLPASMEYYMFLGTYMAVMVCQILVPCWFGTQIIHKSLLLSNAIYDCDWIPQPRRFKTILLLQAARTNRPLTIVGWKMFPVSLTTFTSIMRTGYSFFALLKNVQGR